MTDHLGWSDRDHMRRTIDVYAGDELHHEVGYTNTDQMAGAVTMALIHAMQIKGGHVLVVQQYSGRVLYDRHHR